ncbi:unnamed protein product, partial [Cyprideis torosa]
KQLTLPTQHIRQGTRFTPKTYNFDLDPSSVYAFIPEYYWASPVLIEKLQSLPLPLKALFYPAFQPFSKYAQYHDHVFLVLVSWLVVERSGAFSDCVRIVFTECVRFVRRLTSLFQCLGFAASVRESRHWFEIRRSQPVKPPASARFLPSYTPLRETSQVMFLTRTPLLASAVAILAPLLFWKSVLNPSSAAVTCAVPHLRPDLPLSSTTGSTAGPPILRLALASPKRRSPQALRSSGSTWLPSWLSMKSPPMHPSLLTLSRSLTEEEAASFRDASLISSFPQPCNSFAPSVDYTGPCLSTAAIVILGSPSLWVFLPPFLVIAVTIVALFCRCRTAHRTHLTAPQPSPMPLRLLSPPRRLPHPSLLRRPLSCPADLRLSPVPRPVLPPPRSVSLSSQVMFLTRTPLLASAVAILAPLLFWKSVLNPSSAAVTCAVPHLRPDLPLSSTTGSTAGPPILRLALASPKRRSPQALRSSGSTWLPSWLSMKSPPMHPSLLTLSRSLTEEEAASFRDASLISSFPQPCDSFAPSVDYTGPCLSTAAVAILGSPSLWVFLPPFLVIVVTIVALFCRCRTSHSSRPTAPQPSPMPLRLLSPPRRLPHPSLLRRPLSCPADLRLSPVPRPVLPPPRSVSLSSVSAGPLESFRPSRPLTTEGTMSSSTLASARDQPPTSSLLSPLNPFW